MNYNKNHDEYRIGLDLFFKLKFGHTENPQGWTCLSNIPGINYKKLESKTKEDAGFEVMGIIRDSLELEYREDVFNQ